MVSFRGLVYFVNVQWYTQLSCTHFNCKLALVREPSLLSAEERKHKLREAGSECLLGYHRCRWVWHLLLPRFQFVCPRDCPPVECSLYEEPRGGSYSDPSYSAMYFSEDRAPTSPNNTDMAELKQMLQKQQEQLNHLTQGLLALQAASVPPCMNSVTVTVNVWLLGQNARECHD